MEDFDLYQESKDATVTIPLLKYKELIGEYKCKEKAQRERDSEVWYAKQQEEREYFAELNRRVREKDNVLIFDYSEKPIRKERGVPVIVGGNEAAEKYLSEKATKWMSEMEYMHELVAAKTQRINDLLIENATYRVWKRKNWFQRLFD